MTRRIQKLMVTVAALAALALGGAVFAQAKPASGHGSHHVRHHVVRAASSKSAGPADGDNVQSGDQTTQDNRASSEQSGAENLEQTGPGSESAAGNDGPGGHADAPGNPNADHQFQGNE